ncbi:MAG: hypothetical protein ABII79_09835 [bacterium]
MFEDTKQKVADLVEEPLRQESCELVEVVLSRYRNRWNLKLFIYSEAGTTIDECTRISRLVADIIDGTSLFESGYTLEVSSPGLDRPLKTACDFRCRVGETVRIDYADPQAEPDTAEIVAATDKGVRFRSDRDTFEVELAAIKKATIVF